MADMSRIVYLSMNRGVRIQEQIVAQAHPAWPPSRRSRSKSSQRSNVS